MDATMKCPISSQKDTFSLDYSAKKFEHSKTNVDDLLPKIWTILYQESHAGYQYLDHT